MKTFKIGEYAIGGVIKAEIFRAFNRSCMT